MARNNYGKRTRKVSNNALVGLHPALENLKERLSSPRLKAASTISTYLETSARFLSGLGKDREPTDTDFRRYFVRRRRQGISERTLRKEFFQLKKLAIANNWPWPFGAEGTSDMTALWRKSRAKALATASKAGNRLHPALEKLVELLSSPRLRAPGTLSSYLITGANFLSALKANQYPTDSDFRRYFIQRRQQGISERTLRKEFFHLKKLALANGWNWPFEADDAPYPEKKQEPPVLLQAEVEQLIKSRAKLSSAERFYLAVATTWIVRREELSRIKKRDYDGETFIIHTAKHGRAEHLIPDALKPIFADYRPKKHSPEALSSMLKRICAKAGLEHTKGSGWDSLKCRLNALLKDECLPQNRLSPSLLDDYAYRKKKSSGRNAETDRTEDYRHPEILDSDPYGLDKLIYGIHPFLPLWREKKALTKPPSTT